MNGNVYWRDWPVPLHQPGSAPVAVAAAAPVVEAGGITNMVMAPRLING